MQKIRPLNAETTLRRLRLDRLLGLSRALLGQFGVAFGAVGQLLLPLGLLGGGFLSALGGLDGLVGDLLLAFGGARRFAGAEVLALLLLFGGAARRVGDALVVLDTQSVDFIGVSLDSVGLARTYRGVTVGQDIASASDLAFTYAGVNLECLAPVYLNGNRRPTTADWTLSWTRRTRVGGQWRDYVDATLGEAAESYEIDICASSDYATVKRTLTATTPTVGYTSAQQVSDFAANQATLYVRVYQLSATVGRGYPLTTTITR